MLRARTGTSRNCETTYQAPPPRPWSPVRTVVVEAAGTHQEQQHHPQQHSSASILWSRAWVSEGRKRHMHARGIFEVRHVPGSTWGMPESGKGQTSPPTHNL